MSAQSSPEALERLVDGVWLAQSPVRFLGLRITSTMTVLRLGDGTVLLYSPVAMTPERRAAIDAIGPVAHLYAPNTFHHLWIGEWAAAYPSARLHAPAGLATKRPDLRIDRFHNRPDERGVFAGVVEVPIEGFVLEETVLFHSPTRTLVVADLVHNLGRPRHLWTKVYLWIMGFYDRIALSRMIRWTAFPDRTAARRSLDTLAGLPFERIVVGHGSPIVVDARSALTNAYAWLPRAPAQLPAGAGAGTGAVDHGEPTRRGRRPGARVLPSRSPGACG
jgi:hypothetical protein